MGDRWKWGKWSMLLPPRSSPSRPKLSLVWPAPAPILFSTVPEWLLLLPYLLQQSVQELLAHVQRLWLFASVFPEHTGVAFVVLH